jgi:hypothetical protein
VGSRVNKKEMVGYVRLTSFLEENPEISFGHSEELSLSRA